MNVFHHHLETIETTGLRHLDFRTKPLSKILKNNAVTSSEKSKNILDEVLLIFGEFLPVFLVLTQVNFIDSPEASHLIFVHFPDVHVLDRQNHKTVRVFFQEGFRQNNLGVLTLTWCGNVLRREELSLNTSKGAVVFI